MTDALSTALRELAKSGKSRSQTDRLADYFDDVSAVLAAGVSRAEVLATLATHGFTLSLRGFDKAMSQLRKRRRSSAATAPIAAQAEAMIGAAEPASAGSVPSAPVEAGAAPNVQSPAVLRPPATLPDDWRTTGNLTPQQARLLTHEMRMERVRAREKLFFPNPYAEESESTTQDPPPKAKAEPPGSASVVSSSSA